jgi:hypothetical protein
VEVAARKLWSVTARRIHASVLRLVDAWEITMGSTRRRWPQTLAAAFLAWNGVVAILYAGLVSLPPFSDVPVPLVSQALGIVTLAAAVGVFLGRAWGRLLGVGLTILGMVLEVLRVMDQAARSSSPLELLPFVAVSLAFSGIVLWLLLRRWPTSPRGVRR